GQLCVVGDSVPLEGGYVNAGLATAICSDVTVVPQHSPHRSAEVQLRSSQNKIPPESLRRRPVTEETRRDSTLFTFTAFLCQEVALAAYGKLTLAIEQTAKKPTSRRVFLLCRHHPVRSHVNVCLAPGGVFFVGGPNLYVWRWMAS